MSEQHEMHIHYWISTRDPHVQMCMHCNAKRAAPRNEETLFNAVPQSKYEDAKYADD